MYVHDQRKQCSDSPHIAALPQPLLELILVPGTSIDDKKALRRTCKLFRKTLDDRLSCIKVTAGRIKDRPPVVKLLRRMQHVPGLKTVVLEAYTKAKLDSLLACLPKHITQLRIEGSVNSIKALQKLPCLTSLSLDEEFPIHELQCISGLTHLSYNKRLGNLTHLALTLKHLDMGNFEYVQRMDQLTNLEVLRVRNIPDDFFRTHKKLPLKHLFLKQPTDGTEVLCDAEIWQSTPTTLTRLTLDAPCYELSPDELPAHITHLQLTTHHAYVIENATAALPGLKQFDLCMDLVMSRRYDVFDGISRLTNLQSLGVCVKTLRSFKTDYSAGVSTALMSSEEVMSKFPALTQLDYKGVKLNIISDWDELEEVYGGQPAVNSAWDM